MPRRNLILVTFFAFLAIDFQGCSITGCAARSAGDAIKDQARDLADIVKDQDEAPLAVEGRSEGEVLDELKRRLARRVEAAARLNAEAAILRQQIAQERREGQLATMRTIAWWLAGVSILACIGFVFLKVWLKGVLSGMTTAGIVTFGGVLILCGVFLYFGAALLWLALIAGLVAVGGLALWGAKRILDLRRAVEVTSGMADDLLDRITDKQVVKDAKRLAAQVQDVQGVRRLIARVRGKDPEKPVPP